MEDDKRTVAAVKAAVYYRNYRRARDRALVKLAQANQEEYFRLLEEERARDESEGKTWGRVGTTIIPPSNTRIGKSAQSNRSKQTIRNKGSKGNDGGEA
jgi:hypothetical protein